MKQDEEIYREDILSEVRRIWFDDEARTLSPAKLVETLGINPKILLHSFGSAEGLLAEALSPNGKPPGTTPSDDEFPQLIEHPESGLQDKEADFIHARIWNAYKKLTPDVNPDLDSPTELDSSEC